MLCPFSFWPFVLGVTPAASSHYCYFASIVKIIMEEAPYWPRAPSIISRLRDHRRVAVLKTRLLPLMLLVPVVCCDLKEPSG